MGTDLFRDTPVRYLGYANEIGEAFRALIPAKVVWFTYGIACTYVACDAADKGLTAHKQASTEDAKKRRKNVAITAFDALIWQSLASVIVPGLTINRLCWATQLTLCHVLRMPSCVSRYIVVSAGLAAIPFIIKPIEKAVDHFMDITIRPLLVNSKKD